MNRGTWDEVDFVTHTSGVDSNDQPAQTGRKDIYPPLSPTLKPFRARCTELHEFIFHKLPLLTPHAYNFPGYRLIYL